MRKININTELKAILTQIVNNYGDNETKVANLLLGVSSGQGKANSIVLEDHSDYFGFSNMSNQFISYTAKAKIAEKLTKLMKAGKIETAEIDNALIRKYNSTFYNKTTRTRCKPAKFLARIFEKAYLKENISGSDVENFVNQYKALVKSVELRVVTGAEITKYYAEETYSNESPKGTLLGSCMRPSSKSDYFGIYEKNSNVSMLVAFDESKKVIGRAILWNGVRIKGKEGTINFMDRIYHTHDWITTKFKNWCSENDFWTKEAQSHDNYSRIVSPTGKSLEAVLQVDLEYIQFGKYPYMDTFMHPNYAKGFISNNNAGCEGNTSLRKYDTGLPVVVYDALKKTHVRSNESIFCNSEDNSWAKMEDSVTIKKKEIDSNGKEIKVNITYHKKNAKKDRLGGFIVKGDTLAKCSVTGDEFADRNMIKSDYHDGLINKKESVKTVDQGSVHKDHAVESKYIKAKLSKKGSVFLPNANDYLPSSVLDSGLTVEAYDKVLSELGKLKVEKVLEDEDQIEFTF
jgi:hypothetical protein